MFGPKDMGYKPIEVVWVVDCSAAGLLSAKISQLVSISEDAIFKFVWVSEDGRHNMKMIVWLGSFLYFLGTK